MVQLVTVAICLAWLYTLFSIVKPLPPFRRRTRACVTLIPVTLVGGFTIGTLEMRRVEALKTSDPVAFAKLMAERDAKAAEVVAEQQRAAEVAEQERQRKTAAERQEQEKVKAAEQAADRKRACKMSYKQCQSQEALFEDYNGILDARMDCRRATIKAARYGEPDLPWLDAFQSYFPVENSTRTGRISLVEDDARIPNVYGAKQKSKVKCVYDLDAKKVIEVNASTP